LIVLLDSDGVLGNFVQAVLDTSYEICGIRKSAEGITFWDVFSQLGVDDRQRKQIMREVSRPGWCHAITPLTGAKEFVQTLQEEQHTIYCLTSPWLSAPEWDFERRNWLKDHFNLPPNRVIFAADKFMVRGDVLVDDRSRNVRMWKRDNPLGLSLLFNQPYNRGQDAEGLTRAYGYQGVLEAMDKYATEDVVA
jgi:5'(3')-deoxyribonucleotidase